MNRLYKLFESKKKNLISIFFTAGYPNLDSTVQIIKTLKSNGVDIVEIGIPFSDPLADGPIIQSSNIRALQNGMSLKLLLSQIKEVRPFVEPLPFILMGYLNPIMKYGIEKFFKDAHFAGVDALIIPDLPFDNYMEDFKDISVEYELPVIMLITPETSEERIHLIDNNCDGFIYVVSSASTTGIKESYSPNQLDYFKRIDGMNLKHPRLIGFGISNHSTFSQACENADGAIIGSHFIKCLDKSNGDPDNAVELLLSSICKE